MWMLALVPDVPDGSVMSQSRGPQGTPGMGTPASTQERRGAERLPDAGELVIAWHNAPGRLMRFPTVDISENGARIRTTCCLLDGLTGMAISHNALSTPIDRSVMVVWSRAIRTETGRLDHYEAGLRFF